MYKITVVNLETGDTCVDVEARTICAGIQSEHASQSLSCGEGTAFDWLAAVVGAEKAINKALADKRIKMLYDLNAISEAEED